MLKRFVGAACDAVALAVARSEPAAACRYIDLLQPFASMPPKSSGWIMREFCIATAQVASGHLDRASARYATILAQLPEPTDRDPPYLRHLLHATINGRGLCEASMGSHEALAHAESIASDPFFTPFAESIRFCYYALRGDRENAEASRQRAEQLALHRGISWTAESSLARTSAFAATLTEDAIALVHACADLERLAEAAPKLLVYARICEAWLEHVRGRTERALSLFEAVIHGEDAAGLSTAVTNRALYATVLTALGQHARAEQECLAVLNEPSREGEHTVGSRAVKRALAVAIAGLGRLDEGAALAQAQIAEALPLDNPLELGASHRDRARIALLAGDRAAFDAHYAQMEHYYQRTRNPCLRRQQELLLASAEQHGMRTAPPPARSRPPSGHDALDDLDSETYVGSVR